MQSNYLGSSKFFVRICKNTKHKPAENTTIGIFENTTIENNHHPTNTPREIHPLKRRGKDRFHVVSTWNPRGVCRAYAYSIGKLVFPPLFDEVNNTMSQNLIQKSIEKDIAWAMAEGLPEKEKPMPLLGS